MPVPHIRTLKTHERIDLRNHIADALMYSGMSAAYADAAADRVVDALEAEPDLVAPLLRDRESSAATVSPGHYQNSEELLAAMGAAAGHVPEEVDR